MVTSDRTGIHQRTSKQFSSQVSHETGTLWPWHTIIPFPRLCSFAITLIQKKKIIIIIIIEYLYTFWSAVSYALTYLLVFCSTVSIARNWILVFFHSFPCSHQLLVFHFINYYYSHPFPTHRKKQINFDIIKIENYKIPVPIENTTGEKLPPPSSTPSISLSSSCLTISLSSFSILSIPSFSCLPFFLFSCTSLSSPSDSGHKISSSSES